MELDHQKKSREQMERFKTISDCFVGLSPKLFGYIRGFQELYILFEKQQRCFLAKFISTRYIKMNREWLFQGFNIKLLTYKEDLYEISDQDCFNSDLAPVQTNLIVEMAAINFNT